MMKTVLGYSGNGQAGDKERGHDIVSQTSLDPEWQKTSGAVPANSTTPIQFIWEVPNCVLPTIQINGQGHAKFVVRFYACNDRLARPDKDQDESQDIRSAHWVEISAQYVNFSGSNGASAAFSATAAVINSQMYFPAGDRTSFSVNFRPAWVKVVLTPDGTVATADAIDVFARATDK